MIDKRIYRRWMPLMLFAFSLLVQGLGLSQVPPGLGGDGARLTIHTFDFLYRDVWPFYIYHLDAPNPLIIFLQAPLFLLFGATPAVARALTMVAGALASPLAYKVCRILFANSDSRLATRAGIIAGLALALSPIFEIMSRTGTEHILLPALSMAVVVWLWQGMWRGRWLYFLVGGLILGVSQYSYIVARGFAVALAGAFILALIANRQLLNRWFGLLVAAGSAVLVMLPQLYLFLSAPNTLTARTQQASGEFVFGLANPLSLLLTKFLNQLLMLGWHWDTGYNPFSGRPLLNPILLIGLVVAIAALTRCWRQAPYVFILSLTSLLLVPDLITYEGLDPSATRLTVAYPFIFIVAALGCALVWGWLEHQPKLPTWSGNLVLGAVLIAGLEGQWDFQQRVLPLASKVEGLEWKVSLVEGAEADYIKAHSTSAILIASSEYQRVPLTLDLLTTYPNRAGVINSPLSPGEAVTVITPFAPDRPTTDGPPAGYIADQWVLLKDGTAYFLPPIPNGVQLSENSEALYASNGVQAATAIEGRWLGVQADFQAATASFKNGLEIVGTSATALVPGQPTTVTLYWRKQTPLATDVQIFVQILDRNEQPIAAIHDWPLHGVYRVRTWLVGETVPLSYTFMIPPDAPPGPYRLAGGVFDIIQGQRVPLLDGTDLAPVATLKIPLPPPTTTPNTSVNATFGTAIQLQGYTLMPTNTGLHLDLFWKALAVPESDYTAFVHVVDAAGTIVAQFDSQPRGGQYPTSIWTPGESVEDPQDLAVTPGTYQVFVGLYQWDTGARLPLLVNGQAAPEDQLLLGTVQIP
jgi:4-amino-4-deoxy-L-arabinose transferase-like glycosyltransferase